MLKKELSGKSLASRVAAFTYQCVDNTSVVIADALRKTLPQFAKPLADQGVELVPLQVARNAHHLTNVLRKLPTTRALLPNGWVSFGSVAWEKTVQRSDLVDKIKSLAPAEQLRILQEWEIKLKDVILAAPDVAEGGVYGKVYQVLTLFEKPKLGALSNITVWLAQQKNKDPNNKAIAALLVSGMQDQASAKTWLPELIAMSTTQLVFSDPKGSVKDWQSAMRDKKGDEMVAWVRMLVTGCKPCIRPLDPNKPGFGLCGLPLPPASNRTACKRAASLFSLAWRMEGDMAGAVLGKFCMSMLAMLPETIQPVQKLLETALWGSFRVFDETFGLFYFDKQEEEAKALAPPKSDIEAEWALDLEFRPPTEFGTITMAEMRYRFFRLYESCWKIDSPFALTQYFLQHVNPVWMVLSCYKGVTLACAEHKEATPESIAAELGPEFAFLKHVPVGAGAQCRSKVLDQMLKTFKAYEKDLQAHGRLEPNEPLRLPTPPTTISASRAVKSFHAHRRPLQVDAPLLFKRCSVCDETADLTQRATLQCGHALCDDCYGAMIEAADYRPGAFVQMRAHKCPICRVHVITQPNPALPELVRQFLLRPDQIDPKSVYRICGVAACSHGPFVAGPKQCRDDIANFPRLCEEHRGADARFFECPRCKLSYQLESGCSMMRCCPHGYHGCGEDNGGRCLHKLCKHNGPCGCAFTGCGQRWVITNEERAFGNQPSEFDAVQYALEHEDD